ncbi:hypothetical protein NVS55_40125 (plasmid) [Myxococcus stipitatus]|uniref:hypothetical protein n=1 Tax=Myxococcus stipitatus TaxID=83455 RepID=UPI003144E7AA
MSDKKKAASSRVQNVRQVGIRMTKGENKLAEQIRAALSTPDAEVTMSLLFTTAGIDEAATLGITASTLDSRLRTETGLWKNKPERSYSSIETDQKPITITIHPLYLEIINVSANWCQVKTPTYLWGSLMAFTRRRKVADPHNAALQRIELPEQYEPR